MESQRLPQGAVDSLRDGVAAVAPSGEIKWVNTAWLALGEGQAPNNVLGATVGANLIDVWRAAPGSGARAIAHSLKALIDGEIGYLELEYQLPDGGRRFVISGAPLRGEEHGVVLMLREITARAAPQAYANAALIPRRPEEHVLAIESLTPREGEVLALMARGLDNRAIAAELHIGYTTVRGHVRSVIEKLGARSRLQAVARAYRSGLMYR